MAKTERLTFREAVMTSGLLTADQLAEVEKAIRSRPERSETAGADISDDELADEFVDRHLLTSYQAVQLKEGRTKFRLKDYLILDYVGKGGMGQVFKAVHEMMGRDVAIKVLPRDRCTPDAIRNFQREVRNQAKLDHPNLVRAYDAGRDGNVYFLVTEYVPGTDLRKLVRTQGRLTEPHAAKVIMQAALALDYAHQRNLVHRDVKPGNLLVTPEGRTKVSDLGLAGYIDQLETDPRAGKIVGTPDYLAPEVFRSPRDISPVSDIYSLGCTLYYAVTGKVPFPGGKTRDKIRRHLEEVPWHPLRLNTELSEDFVEIIADMMEKEPPLRIQTAGEVVLRLEPWASAEGPIVSQPTKSRWLPPPLPAGYDLDDTADIYDAPGTESSSGSQISQGTDPVSSALEETESTSTSGLVTSGHAKDTRSESSRKSILFALAIAVPVSLIVGMLIALWAAR